jgi:hypothetical protein
MSFGYVKFSSEPVQNWEAFFEESGVEKNYKVQSGDTLYDISKTLFGDPGFWPKIWSLNSKITNPHIIEKGQVIYFIGGTVSAAPQIGLVSQGATSYVYGKELLRPEIPPPAHSQTKPIQIPNTFPYETVNIKKEYKEVQSLTAGKRAAAEVFRIIEITSEATRTKPEKVGVVERMVSGSRFAKEGDIVYMSIFSGVTNGDLLTVFKHKVEQIPLLKGDKDKESANLTEWLGRIEVVSKAQGGFIGKVVKANSFIQVGDGLSLESITALPLPNQVNSSDIAQSLSGDIKIIGAYKVPGGLAVGEAQVVYLNKGSNSGLEKGQIHPLYANFGDNLLGGQEGFVPKRIGFLKVAKVEGSVSTGVVFNLISEVQVGQRIGL